MAVVYKGILLEGIEKHTQMYHSNALHAMGLDNNEGTEYLDKICEYKRADLAPRQFDEINKLWSVVKMNYQICNGGIHQYFGNRYDEGWKSEDGETEIWDKDEQVKMLQKLYGFAVQVFPENLVENSKLFRIIEFFDSLEYEENVPQYGTVECDEDEEIWDEDLEEYVENPDYFEPYEDVVDYEDEVRTRNSVFKDWSDDVSDKFDNEYYSINEYIEKVVELYAQYLEKAIQKEQFLGVDAILEKASVRARMPEDLSEDVLEQLANSDNALDRVKAAALGYALDRLVYDQDFKVRAAVAERGYGLDLLLRDENDFVCRVAKETHKRMTAEKHIEEFGVL